MVALGRVQPLVCRVSSVVAVIPGVGVQEQLAAAVAGGYRGGQNLRRVSDRFPGSSSGKKLGEREAAVATWRYQVVLSVGRV